MSPSSPSPSHLSSHPPETPESAPSPQSPPSTYTTLTTHLHTHRLCVLSLEILPSTFPIPILHDNLNLGISKRALISSFLTARDIFLSPARNPNAPLSPPADLATKVLLLYDPEHLSAANWRKRRLCHLGSVNGSSQRQNVCDEDARASELHNAVSEEWAFTTSLLTSPLHRHAKSSTLWWHRCWLVRNYIEHLLPHDPVAKRSASQESSSTDGLAALLSAETDVVLQAAERHNANYHAFHYGRRVLSLHTGVWSCEDGERVVEKVRRWCFAHPRDGSGWGFLAFLIRHDGLVMDCGKRKCLIGNVSRQTRDFVTALGWKGESVEWFLREMNDVAKQADAIPIESAVGGIG
ncbi:hypothetical protein MMC15_000689 [Xylographa vitiligo]|nr:hypothetical protein [Xylographa vitiligo]